MKDFEANLSRLEEINQLLKDRELDLEKGIKLFEEGQKLAEALEKSLSQTEKKIEILVNGSKDEDKPELELFGAQ